MPVSVPGWIAVWLLPFIAPIILYFARQHAIHRGWLNVPFPPSNIKDHEALEVLRAISRSLRNIDENFSGHRMELAASLNDIKGNLDRLKQLSEARERDSGMLIYQRIPTPHVSSAAVHLDG